MNHQIYSNQYQYGYRRRPYCPYRDTCPYRGRCPYCPYRNPDRDDNYYPPYGRGYGPGPYCPYR